MRSPFFYNLSWLLACFVLAFVVWIVATIQSDPIVQQTFSVVPVNVELADGYLMVDANRYPTVRVFVRGQQSAVTLLTPDDVIVRADASHVGTGSVTVPLVVSVGRRGVYSVDTQPSQITLMIEALTTAQKPLEVVVGSLPPVDYAYETPQTDVLQAAVSGADSNVSQVASVRATLDLSNRRSPLQVESMLVAVDANGVRVSDVTVEPRVTTLNINIFARDDVRQLAVRPAIQLESIEEGYVLTSISYEPQVIYVSGRADQLVTLGSTVDTNTISLDGMTSDTTIEAGVRLPEGVVILDDTSVITVTLGIAAQTTARQIDNVPIEIIGLPEGYTATLSPDIVSVVLSGPIQTINSLTALDVRAILDLNNVPEGSSERVPQVVVRQGQVELQTTLLPATLTVTISSPLEATPDMVATP